VCALSKDLFDTESGVVGRSTFETKIDSARHLSVVHPANITVLHGHYNTLRDVIVKSRESGLRDIGERAQCRDKVVGELRELANGSVLRSTDTTGIGRTTEIEGILVSQILALIITHRLVERAEIKGITGNRVGPLTVSVVTSTTESINPTAEIPGAVLLRNRRLSWLNVITKRSRSIKRNLLHLGC